jgi:UDP-glucose 4-epimerase
VRILVTGAGGFLGNAVLRHGARLGCELRAHLGPPGYEGLATGLDIDTVHADIADADALGSLAAGVAAVIHMAGPAAVAASFDGAAEYLRAHVLGTETVVRLCRTFGIARLVYVSSAEVYGTPARSPVAEDAPLRPRSPYGAAKAGAESVVGAAVRADGLDAVVLRPFSIYGPGMRSDSVMGTIVAQALAGDEIQLFDTAPIRDFCLVDDVADAVWRACLARSPATPPRTYNIGSGRGTSIAELARAALEALGKRGRVVRRTGRDRPEVADVTELVADVAAARRDLDWEARTPLEAGLRNTLDAWKSVGVRP